MSIVRKKKYTNTHITIVRVSWCCLFVIVGALWHFSGDKFVEMCVRGFVFYTIFFTFSLDSNISYNSFHNIRNIHISMLLRYGFKSKSVLLCLSIWQKAETQVHKIFCAGVRLNHRMENVFPFFTLQTKINVSVKRAKEWEKMNWLFQRGYVYILPLRIKCKRALTHTQTLG